MAQTINVQTVNEDQQLAFAKEFRDISYNDQIVAERGRAELANEFIRLEIQIAAILFGLTSLFIPSMPDILGMKVALALTLFTLLLSLVFGLIHLKRKERFWEDTLNQRIKRFRNWDKVLQRELSYEEARGFHNGSAEGRVQISASPMWMWLMQTIFLGVAVVLIFSLALVFIFSA
jgi:hypothetical protein